ncbi:MAG: GGDEF domain-containing protein [Planctomycetaceae bacterium]
MENLPLLIDVLIMLSVVGSAAAGIMCGWQLCSDNAAKSVPSLTDHAEIAAEPVIAAVGRPLADRSESSTLAAPLPATGVAEPVPLRALEVACSPPPNSFASSLDGSAPATATTPVTAASAFVGVAERLMQMADRITDDVIAHDERLNEVNTSLSGDSQALTMEAVVAAVEKLVKANQLMQSQLSESRDRIVEQAREIEKAELHAHTDALTRIGNRRAFDRELSEWSGTTPGVLAIIDVDHFKRFNDEHGHRAGDEVLKAVAAALQSGLQRHCLVARYGGEEFGLIFKNHELEDVLELIETVRSSISQHATTFEGKTFRVTCSLGVTRMLAGEPEAEWLQRADDALYLSKDAGRDCSHCIDSTVRGQRQPPFKIVLPGGPKSSGERTSDPCSRVSTAKAPGDAAAAAARRHAIKEALQRIPDRASLRKSYAELLQRLGKSPVKLSVIALSVAEPETALDASSGDGNDSRLLKLIEVTKSFCRAVDRVGSFDDATLLVYMPGLEGVQATGRLSQLKGLVAAQLELNADAFRLGLASAKVGDTFDDIVDRAAAARV